MLLEVQLQALLAQLLVLDLTLQLHAPSRQVKGLLLTAGTQQAGFGHPFKEPAIVTALLQLQQPIYQAHLGAGIFFRQTGPLALGLNRGPHHVELTFNCLLLALKGCIGGLDRGQRSSFFVGNILLGCLDLFDLIIGQSLSPEDLQLDI